MAVEEGRGPVKSFEDWYDRYEVDERDGCLSFRHVSKIGLELWRLFDSYKREMDARLGNYEKLEKIADNEVISPKDDLPNISSGETSGLVRRVARSIVQNTPNVEVTCEFDDDSVEGILARHVLTTKVIGSDLYSNDMQQNLFASVKTAFTLGFDAVVPVLLQDAQGSWYIKYDPIHYRDVFPEPGAKDVRDAETVFIRRYLTMGEVKQLVRDNTPGWDLAALRALCKTKPPVRETQSTSHQDKKRKVIPEGYEIVTWYTSSGDNFLTMDVRTKMLLRIEKNKHPLKKHPVHFLILEKDSQQPLGKSQVELILGRQDFQDLMLNGAMKLYYRNINPSIIGYGASNVLPNLSPGKYTQISNPNAKIEAFEVNTQTLMQFGMISQQNLGSMVNMVGAPDQQMQQAAGNGMSSTPQGVEAQATVVDVTTNNFQKAVEQFFSHFCSYALTMYFAELAAAPAVKPSWDAKKKLVEAGLNPGSTDDEGNPLYDGDFNEDGTLKLEFKNLATVYYVRCVPGSLVELEDEKQLRILNELFIPLSQAMNAIAASGDQAMMAQAVSAMQYIIRKQIELSGSSSSIAINELLSGESSFTVEREERLKKLELAVGGIIQDVDGGGEGTATVLGSMQKQMSLMTQNMQLIMEGLGATNHTSTTTPAAEPVPAV